MTDGFDCYSAINDMQLGYWDSVSNVANFSLVTGRFSGSRGLGSTAGNLIKNSGANDGVHHLCIAIQQAATITGSTLGYFFTFGDGATAQCSVVFRSDGALLLAAGASTGTVLATYTGAIALANTWYHFEIEVNVSNTAGYMKVRKNGNTTEDFSSATNLDTSANANNYANRITIGGGALQQIDDFIWQSSASAGSWIGETRCRTRMPAGDAGVQWTPSAAILPSLPMAGTTTSTGTVNSARYLPFTAACNGTVGSVAFGFTVASTANWKAAIYNNVAGVPTTVVATSSVVASPGIGTATFTFGSPPTLVAGTAYFVAVIEDGSSGTYTAVASGNGGLASSTTVYASWPISNPTSTAASAVPAFTVNITPTGAANAPFVADITQDAANSYVYSSTVGQTDRYTISAIDTTPATTFCTTVRALLQKSDAGTRNTSVLLKSGATEVATPSAALNASAWGWQARTDLVDPATGSAWTAISVNNLLVGVTVTA